MNAHFSASSTGNIKHFLNISDLDSTTLRDIITLAKNMKAMQENRKFPLHPAEPLKGRMVALIFSKPSTRTRVSFEVGVKQLGGSAIVLSTHEMQIGRGETIQDTARVLSRFVDAIVLRTGSNDDLLELAHWSSVPVINGLTPFSHPSQVMADIITFEEHLGPIKGRTIAWVGDGNNVANSLIEAAAQFEFKIRLATPETLMPSEKVLQWAKNKGADILLTRNPKEAVSGADCVVTDTWVSMSDDDSEKRLKILEPYRVNQALMALAAPNAIFMHCLPAHVGEEVTKDVFESARSVVFDEAENRLHAHKAMLIWCMMGDNWRQYGER